MCVSQMYKCLHSSLIDPVYCVSVFSQSSVSVKSRSKSTVSLRALLLERGQSLLLRNSFISQSSLNSFHGLVTNEITRLSNSPVCKTSELYLVFQSLGVHTTVCVVCIGQHNYVAREILCKV